jgi:signal transduction histidine kinase
MSIRLSLTALRAHAHAIFVVSGTLLIALLVGILLFQSVQSTLRQQLRNQLRTTAAIIAMQFTGEELQAIDGVEDLESLEFKNIANRLDRLRRKWPAIRYAYILRHTPDPMVLSFVVDADSLLAFAELDRNRNGELEADEEPSYPGDLYDITDVPPLQGEAFLRATVDQDATVDALGRLISGYAPIHNADGTPVAVLGIDMTEDAFVGQTGRIVSPMLLLLALLAVMTMCSSLIQLFWKHRMQLLSRVEAERSGVLQLMFHQLGEPLTIFKWSLENLRECPADASLPDAVKEHCDNAQVAIARMNQMVDALIQAERVEKNTLTYMPERLPLRLVADEVIAEFRRLMEIKKITLFFTVGAEMVVHADRTLVMAVFRELIDNAVIFSREKGMVTISAERQGNEVLVAVRDGGHGIALEDLDRVFHKYVRGKNARAWQPDGNGLGLYIARGIVERHGGRMWLLSEVEKGTTIFFTLPVA